MYDRAHRRVKALWGLARQYPCVKCGGPARHWAYDWTDPSSLENYSHWPEFYMPLCFACHRHYDQVECYAIIRSIRRVPQPPVELGPPAHPRSQGEWARWHAAHGRREW